MNIEATETVNQGNIEDFCVDDIVFIQPGSLIEELEFAQSRPPIKLKTTGHMVYPGKFHTCVVQVEIVGRKQTKVLRALQVNDKGEFLFFPIYFLPNESTILTHVPDVSIKRII